MAWMITQIVQNRFDCFIIVEGQTGLGKSTLAIHLARRVSQNFKKMGSKDYKFNWRHTFLYTAKETKQFLHRWRSIGIGDEAINVVHNRDFYSEDSKTIIKMQNMNRDHCNLFIMCVPSFATLDSQIKNLCKIRITVVRRGLAVIQTPNKTIYIKDRWDTATNEKIERQWVKKGIRNPHYSKLTTFRGIMKFPKLSESAEAKYQATKDSKRNLVAQEEMGLEEEASNDPYDIAVAKLKANEVKNAQIIEGMAFAHDIKPDSFKRGIMTRLKKQGLPTALTSYYWEGRSSRSISKTVGEELQDEENMKRKLTESLGK